MNVLPVYPKFPDTFRSFTCALSFAPAAVDPESKAETDADGHNTVHLRLPLPQDL